MGDKNNVARLTCPFCDQDVSLAGHQVELDGTIIANTPEGRDGAFQWRESCPNCGCPFEIALIFNSLRIQISPVLSLDLLDGDED